MHEHMMTAIGLLMIVGAVIFAVWHENAPVIRYVSRFAGLKVLSEEEALSWVRLRVALWCDAKAGDVPPSQPLKECHVRRIQRRVRHDFGIDLSKSLAARPTVEDVARALAIMSQSRLGKANTTPPPST